MADILHAKDVAELLGIEPGTLFNRVCAGTAPPSHKTGRKRIWLRNELMAWIQVQPDAPRPEYVNLPKRRRA